MDFSKLSSKQPWAALSMRSLRVLLPTLVLPVLLLGSCRGSGPDVILVPALTATRTQIRVAESFSVKVMVTLPDGTVTFSKKKVKFPAGVWITFVSEEEMNQ